MKPPCTTQEWKTIIYINLKETDSQDRMIRPGQIARVNHAMEAIQRKLNLIIESILNVQKGILQPQIVSLKLIIEPLQTSASRFPKDTMAPFTLSKDSSHLLLRICDVHIYI